MFDNPGWLEYIISSNPQGVMSVLNRNGYTSYLAPQDQDELYEASQEFIHSKGDYAVIELLKTHPLYDVISDIVREENHVTSFKNADGSESSVLTKIKKIDYRKLAETALIVIGAFFVADKIWTLINKE